MEGKGEKGGDMGETINNENVLRRKWLDLMFAAPTKRLSSPLRPGPTAAPGNLFSRHLRLGTNQRRRLVTLTPSGSGKVWPLVTPRGCLWGSADRPRPHRCLQTPAHRPATGPYFWGLLTVPWVSWHLPATVHSRL